MEALESALAQPRVTFGGEDLYPKVAEKAAALGFSLIMNHPLVDGNKRTGHAAMEVFLLLNGYEIDAEDAVQMMAAVRSGAQYLVTRNVRDYGLGPLPVLRPAELLAIL